MKKISLMLLAASLITFIGLTSCDNDNDNDGDDTMTGRVNVKVTDAPIDAENVTGVYLSVSAVEAHGNGDTRTFITFDDPKVFNVLDYQEGSTFDLGEGSLAAGTYSELRLILTDGDPSDENSASYIEFEDQTTEELVIPSGTTSGYKIHGDFEVNADGQTDLIVDIDLRKALVSANNQFMLRPTARLIVEDHTSTIEGTVSDLELEGNERMVVYAYAQGTYTGNETDTPADGETRFENSVNSDVVAEDGSFTLAFMEAGEYELIVATYEYDEADEEFEFTTATVAEAMVSGEVLDVIDLEANADVSVTLNVLL